MNEERLEAIRIFIEDFNIITDCLYNSNLRTSKADEYYNTMLLVKGYLEDEYYEEWGVNIYEWRRNRKT